MTIKELRKAFRKNVEFDRATNDGLLEDYLKTEWATLETLYAEGAVTRKIDYISDDMLALAAGYDPNVGYDPQCGKGFATARCLDLAYIYADKKHVRNMMMLFLGISEPQKSAHAEQEQQETVKETESAPEQTAEQEQQEKPATTESGNQDNAETDTYEHALKMAMYATECGDGVQAIYHKDGKFKAGLKSDREYAEKNGWQYFHTVWETVPEEERTRAEKWEEIKEARKKSLFWAKRMCYKSADYHPEWKEEYEKAKKHVEEVKTKYEETEPEEPVQEANTESGTVLGKSDWNGKIARLKAVVSYFKSHNMHWEANKAYKHNWKFYREHTAEECIRIISKECNPNPKAHTALQKGR